MKNKKLTNIFMLYEIHYKMYRSMGLYVVLKKLNTPRECLKIH